MTKYITIVLLSSTIWLFAQDKANEIRPYQEVITSEALSSKGFVTTHLQNDRLYLELPKSLLGKDLLFVNHSIQSSNDYRQIQLNKRGNTVELILPEIESKVGNTIPSIEGTFKFNIRITPITFPILAITDDQLRYVIDVTSLFLATPKVLTSDEIPMLTGRGDPGSGLVVNDLAFINKVKAFDTTVEVETTKTFTSKNGPQTLDVNFSVFLLPEPMMPRLFDHRTGFFPDTGKFWDLPVRGAIMKWRLKKKHEDRALSEPIKPITLYFDEATPDKWKPYIKAGIEQWLPAFEAAGFKNALEIKDTPMDDINWSMSSMRYALIQWVNRGKYRGHEGDGSAGADWIVDKRTGEILKGDLRMGLMDIPALRYFVRCSPLDPRAQKYPFPDDLMGELVESLAAHEMGHVLGLIDANYGEFAYPFEKMRDKQWLRTMGHTPSIMTYDRENYVAQPEDSIPPELLQQKVGPMDLYSIRWGYTPIPEAKTPDEELSHLEKIIREQDSIPWYRFTPWAGWMAEGPGETNEVVTSDDPIKATLLGVENLKRVIKLIPHATKNERTNANKSRLYYEALRLWVNQMKSVVSLVGGYTIYNKSAGQQGQVYTPIPPNRQKEAVAFLNTNAFKPPLWLSSPDITERAGINLRPPDYRLLMNTTLKNISQRQLTVLRYLLDSKRLRNLEKMGFESGYTLIEFFQDLQNGIWDELDTKNIKIDPYRQEIHIGYITEFKYAIEKEGRAFRSQGFPSQNKYEYSNYMRGAMFSELQRLKSKIEKSLKSVKDPATRGHLELCLLEIDSVNLNGE